MGKTMRALGLMSGTSMDGIDVALIETDGEEVLPRGPQRNLSLFAGGSAASSTAAIEEAKSLERREERPGTLAGCRAAA